MAKPNYAYEKRQRELEKKKKKEEKALKKTSGPGTGAEGSEDADETGGDAPMAPVASGDGAPAA